MRHMSHPDNPDHEIEVDDEAYGDLMEKAGWQYVKSGPKPDDKK